jgi:CBS domain-containing protein
MQNAGTSGTVDAILQQKGRNVWSVPPSVTVFEAIQLMADKNVGALLVMEAGQLVGIMSERDYTRKVALQGRLSRETTVREILSDQVVVVRPDTTIEECMRLMTANYVRHLPVVDEGRVVGVVSIGDLVNWIISAQSAMIQQLQCYITGTYPD